MDIEKIGYNDKQNRKVRSKSMLKTALEGRPWYNECGSNVKCKS